MSVIRGGKRDGGCHDWKCPIWVGHLGPGAEYSNGTIYECDRCGQQWIVRWGLWVRKWFKVKTPAKHDWNDGLPLRRGS